MNRPVTTITRVRRGVIGILEQEGAYLMIQRSATVAKPGAWCFPGGHVEPSETPRQAVVRELFEELGIVVEPRLRLGAVKVHDSRYVLAVWSVVHRSGVLNPAAKEIADIRWIRGPDIEAITPGLLSNGLVWRMLCDRSCNSPG